MNRWITAALVVAVLLTGSCKRPTADDESNTTAKIETMTVKPRDLMTTVGYPATMNASMAATPRPSSTRSMPPSSR